MPGNINIIPRPVPRIDLSAVRLQKLGAIRGTISMRVVIPDKLKAGGSVRREFKAEITPKGAAVDLSV